MLWWCTRQKHDLVFSFSASFSLFYHCVLLLAILLVSSCFPGSETPIPNLTQKRYSWSTLLHWISERKWIYEELWTRCFPTLTIQSDWDKHSSQTSYESRKTVIVIWIRWTHWWIALFFFPVGEYLSFARNKSTHALRLHLLPVSWETGAEKSVPFLAIS